MRLNLCAPIRFQSSKNLSTNKLKPCQSSKHSSFPEEVRSLDIYICLVAFAVEPKQAWTNVADFTSRGVDAVNLGPGQTRYAHTREERVELAAMERVFGALQRFLLDGTV